MACWLPGGKLTSYGTGLLSLPIPGKVSWRFSPQPPPLPKGVSGLKFYGLKSQEMATFWSRVTYKQGTLGKGAGHLNEMHQHLTAD